jgi:hypothetical protein
MTMDEQIEMERAEIVAAELHLMQSEGIEPAHDVIWSRLEAKFSGFQYEIDRDSYERFLPIAGEMDTAEPADTAAAEPATDRSAMTADLLPVDADALRALLDDLSQQAGELRAKVFAATEARQAARADLAAAIGALISKQPRMTDADLRREFLAASAAERAQAKRDGRSAPVHAAGPSTLDRNASWARSGNFASNNLKVGHRRGAYSQAMRGATVKPQSER